MEDALLRGDLYYFDSGNEENSVLRLLHSPFPSSSLIEQSLASVPHLAAGPRLRRLVVVSAFMPPVCCLHLEFVSFRLFLLLEQWSLSPLPEGPARQQLCFIQSCVSLKQEGPLQKPTLQSYSNQSSFVLPFFFISFKDVVSINFKSLKKKLQVLKFTL